MILTSKLYFPFGFFRPKHSEKHVLNVLFLMENSKVLMVTNIKIYTVCFVSRYFEQSIELLKLSAFFDDSR